MKGIESRKPVIVGTLPNAGSISESSSDELSSEDSFDSLVSVDSRNDSALAFQKRSHKVEDTIALVASTWVLSDVGTNIPPVESVFKPTELSAGNREFNATAKAHSYSPSG